MFKKIRTFFGKRSAERKEISYVNLDELRGVLESSPEGFYDVFSDIVKVGLSDNRIKERLLADDIYCLDKLDLSDFRKLARASLDNGEDPVDYLFAIYREVLPGLLATDAHKFRDELYQKLLSEGVIANYVERYLDSNIESSTSLPENPIISRILKSRFASDSRVIRELFEFALGASAEYSSEAIAVALKVIREGIDQDLIDPELVKKSLASRLKVSSEEISDLLGIEFCTAERRHYWQSWFIEKLLSDKEALQDDSVRKLLYKGLLDAEFMESALKRYLDESSDEFAILVDTDADSGRRGRFEEWQRSEFQRFLHDLDADSLLDQVKRRELDPEAGFDLLKHLLRRNFEGFLICEIESLIPELMELLHKKYGDDSLDRLLKIFAEISRDPKTVSKYEAIRKAVSQEYSHGERPNLDLVRSLFSEAFDDLTLAKRFAEELPRDDIFKELIRKIDREERQDCVAALNELSQALKAERKVSLSTLVSAMNSDSAATAEIIKQDLPGAVEFLADHPAYLDAILDNSSTVQRLSTQPVHIRKYQKSGMFREAFYNRESLDKALAAQEDIFEELLGKKDLLNAATLKETIFNLVAENPKLLNEFINRINAYDRFWGMIEAGNRGLSIRNFPNFVVSFPRSGSNHLQNVLKQSSKFHSQSIYSPLSVSSNVVMTLKSHALSFEYLSNEARDFVGIEQIEGRKILWLIRDPRDLMISFYEYVKSKRGVEIDQADFLQRVDFFYASTIDKKFERKLDFAPINIMAAYKSFIRNWLKYVKKNNDTCRLIRYEDVVSEPESTFRSIGEFLGFQLDLEYQDFTELVSLYSKESRKRGQAFGWKSTGSEYGKLVNLVNEKFEKEIKLLNYDIV